MSFLGKFTKRLLGLNHVVFCNPDFAEVETQTRWFECRKLGSTHPRGQHGSKRQDGLEHIRSFTNDKKVIVTAVHTNTVILRKKFLTTFYG